MNSTEVKVVSDKTFETIHTAVNKMVDMIRPTFGPASKKVIIDKMPYRMVVDDGVQIARDFELTDPAENAVVKIVRETAIRTNDRVGDGTTGALIMLQSIINEVARKGKFEGRKIELELKKALQDVRDYIDEHKVGITTKEDLKKVALVSFDDEEVAEMIADAYFKVGKDGVVTLEKSETMKTTLELTNGVQMKSGYVSPYMVNKQERMENVLEKAHILITDYRLTESDDIVPIMELMVQNKKRNLVVIAENIEQRALATMVINLPHVMNPHTQKPGTFPSVAIALPKVEDRKTFIEDIALLTGAKVFSTEKGDKLEEAKLEDLGQAAKVICRGDESIIVEPEGDKAAISTAVSQLQMAIDAEADQKKKEKLRKRYGMLTNSIAVMKVGAPTENEQKALKYKAEDAVNAVEAAYRGGVVRGSGIALSHIKTSSPLLNAALKMPARQLFQNMELNDDDEYLAAFGEDEALNVVTGKVGKFMDVGVVDPAEVLYAGVESAVSIASLLLTSTGMLVEHQVPHKQD